MARITVEDCMEHMDNLFDLVLIASKRARRIANGAPVLVPEDNDKPTVIALREIAEGLITPEFMEASEHQIHEEVQEAPDHGLPTKPPPLLPIA